MGKKHYRTGIDRVRLDNAGRDHQNTVFGEQIVASRIPHIIEKFQYNISTSTTITTVANNGTVTHSGNVAVISSSTTTNGAAKLESMHTVRYVPGAEGYAFFTARFNNGGVAGAKQHVGLFDDTDGYYLGFDGTDFIVGTKKDSTQAPILQANFNLDPLDGTGASGYTIDPTKMNVFKISYGWLGVAPITWEVMMPDGTFIAFHQMHTTGLTTSPHTSNPTFPICFDVTKTSGATDIIIHTASWNGGITPGDADVAEAANRYFTGTIAGTGITAETVLINFQNVSTFQSKTNRVEIHAHLLGMSSEGNKPAIIKIYKNLTITSPTWANVDATNSVMQTDTAGTITPSDANLLFAFPLARSDSNEIDVKGMDFVLAPGDTATVTGQSSVNTDLTFTARWAEHF